MCLSTGLLNIALLKDWIFALSLTLPSAEHHTRTVLEIFEESDDSKAS